MTFAQRQQRELDRAIRAALKAHGSVRLAASALGMPHSTLHDRACALGVHMGWPKRRRRKTRTVRRGR